MVSHRDVDLCSASNAAKTKTYLLRVDCEWTFGAARATEGNLDLRDGALEEGSEYFAALPAVELDILELRGHSRSSRHDTRDSHQLIQMILSEISQRVRRR